MYPHIATAIEASAAPRSPPQSTSDSTKTTDPAPMSIDWILNRDSSATTSPAIPHRSASTDSLPAITVTKPASQNYITPPPNSSSGYRSPPAIVINDGHSPIGPDTDEASRPNKRRRSTLSPSPTPSNPSACSTDSNGKPRFFRKALPTDVVDPRQLRLKHNQALAAAKASGSFTPTLTVSVSPIRTSPPPPPPAASPAPMCASPTSTVEDTTAPPTEPKRKRSRTVFSLITPHDYRTGSHCGHNAGATFVAELEAPKEPQQPQQQPQRSQTVPVYRSVIGNGVFPALPPPALLVPPPVNVSSPPLSPASASSAL
ncbi:hypothetical protein HDU96_003654, partial [Phlyctochytrium bullatum]